MDLEGLGVAADEGGGIPPEMMQMLAGGMGGGDPEEIKRMNEEHDAWTKLKVCETINKMDAEFQERFKALKVIQSLLHDHDEEEQKQIRELELVYEEKYKEIYKMREQYINAKSDLSKELIAEFDERAIKMKDEDYEKVDVTPCDVKAIQNSPKGVGDFWLKSLLNHPIGSMISEKDRPILGYLLNIELDLHDKEKGDGYDLIFTFQDNSYFSPSVITKEMHMAHNKGMCSKTVSTNVQWKDNCDPTKKKQKKKRKGKKVTVEVKTDSFFNFFKDEDPSKEPNFDPEKEEEDGEMMTGIEEQLDVADQIKDDLVPLALEYYLGVIDIDDDEEGGDDSDDGAPGGKKKKGGSDDEDDDDKKKPKYKPSKKSKGKGPGFPPGMDGKDCKQQ